MLLRKFSDCFHALVKATYDYMLNLASRRNAMYFLFAVAFIESSFFPIPPDVMLIPMVWRRRQSLADCRHCDGRQRVGRCFRLCYRRFLL